MGFSGVQLVGTETPARVRIISGRIRQALEEFTSFPQWLEEYNSYLGSAEMSPIPDGYRLYDRILYREYSATELKYDGKDYLIVKEEDILATL